MGLRPRNPTVSSTPSKNEGSRAACGGVVPDEQDGGDALGRAALVAFEWRFAGFGFCMECLVEVRIRDVAFVA